MGKDVIFDRVLKRKNHALIIGISKYGSKAKSISLSNPKKDAEDFKNVLIKQYNFKDENIELLTNSKATRKSILNSIKGYCDKLKENDNLLILFSGHGDDSGNVGYWIPYGAEKGEDTSFISSSDILDRLKNINCHHLLLIIDACYSGKIFRSGYRDALNLKGDKERSRYGISACHSKEKAFDGTPGDNSPFMKFLLKELKKNSRPIGAYELAQKVGDKVYVNSEGKQSPIYQSLMLSEDESGQFFFIPKDHIYAFDSVLDLLEKKKYTNAKEELVGFCLNKNELPKGYEYSIFEIKFLLRYREKNILKEEEFNEIIDDHIDRRINYFFNNQEPIECPKFIGQILELTSNQDVLEALEILFDEYIEVSNQNVCRVILLKATYGTINESIFEGEIKPQDHVEIIIEFIANFLNTLKSFENKNFKKDDSEEYDPNNKCLDEIPLTRDKKKNQQSINLLKDYFTNNLQLENLFLLEMLEARQNKFENEFYNFDSKKDKETLEIEGSLIRKGIDFMIRKRIKLDSIKEGIIDERIEFKNLLEKKRKLFYEILFNIGSIHAFFESISENKLLEFLKEGEIDKILGRYHDFQTDSAYVSDKVDWRNASIAYSQRALRHLFYNILRSSISFEEDYYYQVRIKQTHTVNKKNNLTAKLGKNKVKELFGSLEKEELLEFLLMEIKEENRLIKLRALKRRLELNQEDKYFSNKNQNLVRIRDSRISSELMEFINTEIK